MPTVASRLTSTGTLFISGEFNEISVGYTKLDLSGNQYAQLFDEVSMYGNSVAKRETNTGTLMVANGFNEVNKPV